MFVVIFNDIKIIIATTINTVFFIIKMIVAYPISYLTVNSYSYISNVCVFTFICTLY